MRKEHAPHMRVCRQVQTHSTAHTHTHTVTSSTLIPLQGSPCLSRLGALNTSNQRNLSLTSLQKLSQHARTQPRKQPRPPPLCVAVLNQRGLSMP